jgi:outer membrane lipoprotein-sorting protein
MKSLEPAPLLDFVVSHRKGTIMRFVLSVLLLHALVTGSPAQDNEAERLFRAMENKIKSAKAIQVNADIELRAIKGKEDDSKIGNGVSKAKGNLLLTKDNQVRLTIRNEYLGMILISDGKQLKLLSDQDDLDEAKARPTPKHLHNLVSTLVRRLGLTGGSMILRFAPGPQFEPVFLRPAPLGEKDFDADKVEGWGVGGFKAGADTKVGGHDAKVVNYRIGGPKAGKDAIPVTLWLDAKTLPPFKSIVVIQSENLHITETYTDFKLDPKIDAKAFALVYPFNDAAKLFRAMEEKIKTAKVVEVTFEFSAKVKSKEEKLKGSLVFSKDNKARLTMRVPDPGEGEDRIEMVSDGKQMKVAYPPKETLAKTETLRTPAALHDLLASMVSGPSMHQTYDMLNVPEWFPDGGKYTGPGRWPFRVVDFEAAPTTKVGGRDARVITYRVLDLPGPGGSGDITFTLWIDAETLLPLKHLLVADGPEGPVSVTEVCNVRLNPKIDAGIFVLPK